MLELYQFELSHFSEKVRFILDYKNLPYRKIEVTPGIGQLDLFRLSGQRQVPVLKDGDDLIAGSTAIAFYLEKKYPDPAILPINAQQRALTLMLEEWADASIALNGRTAMIGAFNQAPEFRKAFFPNQTPAALTKLVNDLPDAARNLGNLVASNLPNALKAVVGAVPGDVLSAGGAIAGFGSEAVAAAKADLAQNLEALSLMLSEKPYLIGDQPTLADFAVAGLSMYIKFPASPALDIPMGLKGQGVPGLADNPAYKTFFDWRDKLYLDYRKIDETRPPVNTPAEGVPQKISID
ncbi:MAG: glutathione S-transferase family protein [Synechococcales cyanobacterium RM1_1_8]|nr:glutathione S-transferase family protein [Synechococcales cyanobacterium RM1_1_8]